METGLRIHAVRKNQPHIEVDIDVPREPRRCSDCNHRVSHCDCEEKDKKLVNQMRGSSINGSTYVRQGNSVSILYSLQSPEERDWYLQILLTSGGRRVKELTEDHYNAIIN